MGVFVFPGIFLGQSWLAYNLSLRPRAPASPLRSYSSLWLGSLSKASLFAHSTSGQLQQ